MMKRCKVVWGRYGPMLLTWDEYGYHISIIFPIINKDGNTKVTVGLEDMII